VTGANPEEDVVTVTDRKRVLYTDEEPQLAQPTHQRLPDSVHMSFCHAETRTIAAAKAGSGFSTVTAYRLEQNPRL
jgi:hypothetical protein